MKPNITNNHSSYSAEEAKYANSNSCNKPSIILLCVPEVLEASIIDDAQYYSEQYLKNQDIFSFSNNMKATKKKHFMSRWITKVQYNHNKSYKQNIPSLSHKIYAEDLYNEIYPKSNIIKLHKIKIICFLDPNTYNNSNKHKIRIPSIKDNDKFGDVHITYLPAAKQSKDSYHTSCDYNGYHFTYKLYDYVNLKKNNGVQYVAETYFYKQKIGGNKSGKKCILDLKGNTDDNYVAFLLCFVWNLFSIFDECCKKDGQMRKSIKYKICKKMANVLNKQHFDETKVNQIANKCLNNKRNNIYNNRDLIKSKFKNNDNKQKNLSKFNDNNNDNYSFHSSSARPNYYDDSNNTNNSCKYHNNGPLKMEMW